jgi:hypothetical protein
MVRATILITSLAFFAASALADEKPTADEASKLNEALTALGCSGGEMEKESEAGGVFEVDDAKCKDGQFDLKFDKDFKLLNMDRD